MMKESCTPSGDEITLQESSNIEYILCYKLIVHYLNTGMWLHNYSEINDPLIYGFGASRYTSHKCIKLK